MFKLKRRDEGSAGPTAGVSGEARRVLCKYPDRVPVICVRRDPKLWAAGRKKFLIHSRMPCSDLESVILKHLDDGSGTFDRRVTFRVGGRRLPTEGVVSDLYSQQADQDGFMYVDVLPRAADDDSQDESPIEALSAVGPRDVPGSQVFPASAAAAAAEAPRSSAATAASPASAAAPARPKQSGERPRPGEHCPVTASPDARRILAKFPNRVPVVCEQLPKAGLPPLRKHQFLLPLQMRCCEFEGVVRGHLEEAGRTGAISDTSLRLFLNGELPQNPQEEVCELYKAAVSPDGFLRLAYGIYSAEKAATTSAGSSSDEKPSSEDAQPEEERPPAEVATTAASRDEAKNAEEEPEKQAREEREQAQAQEEQQRGSEAEEQSASESEEEQERHEEAILRFSPPARTSSTGPLAKSAGVSPHIGAAKRGHSVSSSGSSSSGSVQEPARDALPRGPIPARDSPSATPPASSDSAKPFPGAVAGRDGQEEPETADPAQEGADREADSEQAPGDEESIEENIDDGMPDLESVEENIDEDAVESDADSEPRVDVADGDKEATRSEKDPCSAGNVDCVIEEATSAGNSRTEAAPAVPVPRSPPPSPAQPPTALEGSPEEQSPCAAVDRQSPRDAEPAAAAAAAAAQSPADVRSATPPRAPPSPPPGAMSPPQIPSPSPDGVLPGMSDMPPSWRSTDAEARRMVARYPDRVPVICEKALRADLPDIARRRFLVPGSMLCSEFKYIIHQHVREAMGGAGVAADQTIYLFVGTTSPKGGVPMAELYDRYRADDGLLHLAYGAENTLGGFPQQALA